MKRDKRKEMLTGHDNLQWFGHEAPLRPTPLPEYPTREFTTLLNKLPLGGENRTHLCLHQFTTLSKMSSPNASQDQTHDTTSITTQLLHDFTTSSRLHDYFTTSSILHYLFTHLLLHNYMTSPHYYFFPLLLTHSLTHY